VTSRVLVGDNPTSAILRAAVEVLANGGIVAYPTDTLYGLAVDPRQEAAVDQLCRLKGRARGVGMPLIAADLRQVESWLGALPPLGRRLARRFWPGPLTLVFEPEVALVPAIHATDGSLAVRVPRCDIARRLAGLRGHPITATSANRAGMPPAATGRDVVAVFGSSVGLMLEQRGRLAGEASTIVDARGVHPTLLRAGVVPWDRVLQSLA
jgi:L-threonylcarbamoyladenylate synthase